MKAVTAPIQISQKQSRPSHTSQPSRTTYLKSETNPPQKANKTKRGTQLNPFPSPEKIKF
ncbi:hypothetical protein [Lactobacillus equicursoris]|uniref:hypothetical protein n=1 Tax=Lactobacillus equicursoris TaxID=420645 RepID=UPI003992F78B